MKLTDWLKKSGMRDVEFARLIKMSPATVLHLKAGTRRPSLSTIEIINKETGGEVTAQDWIDMRKARPRKATGNPSKPRVAA
jgi:transcriptional regulator with XRE-family HTH domain